jgi:gamma-glutamylaminecyclotransferase
MSPGAGHQVRGELYEVTEASLVVMDRLERLGEPNGYFRVLIEVEAVTPGQLNALTAYVSAKTEEQAASEAQCLGPFVEYTSEHAARFKWQGAE